MYEYLLENLISYNQVEGNIRRTTDRGLVSELYRKQLNALALKYFGVDLNGNYTDRKENIIAYRCPYSGEIIKDLSNAHLEHILPVSSNGGTILFNCIPILNKVNTAKRDEPNLLTWWKEQDYFNYDRLERLIEYMLEAYSLSFKEPNEEDLYEYDISLNDDYIENDDLSMDLNDKTSMRYKFNNQENITYYQLINDLINELSKNRNATQYYSKLESLKEQNVFGNITELEKVIKTVQNIFKEVLEDNSKNYLSYSINIDMNRLLKSLRTEDYESEIRQRLSFIIKLVKDNGKDINDYFESIQDMKAYNLLYYNNPTDKQITDFINNIKINHESKIKIFIEMLSNPKYTNYLNGFPDSNNIFSSSNKVSFEGYEHIAGLNTSYFWHANSSKIIDTIYAQKKELESKENRTQSDNERLNKLNIALKAIDDYEFANIVNLKRRIDKFIEMLSNPKYTNYINGLPDSKNIFSSYNEVSFEGYEHISGLSTSKLWVGHSNLIIKTINIQKKELESKKNRTEDDNERLNKLNIALKSINDYEFSNKNNAKRRIDKFIEMLSNPKYTNYINGFPDNNNIFCSSNEVKFEGYEHIAGLSTSRLWLEHSIIIIKTINIQKKELESKENRTEYEDERLNKLNIALKSIDDYNFSNKSNAKRRIDKFIEMLSNPKYTNYINGLPDSNNIFSDTNEVSFEGYEHIAGLSTSKLWSEHSNIIIKTINIQKKELESKENRTEDDNERLNKLNIALKSIDDHEFANILNINRRIDKFIEMLSNPKYTNYINGFPDNNNIFCSTNEVKFEGYEHIKGLNTSQFWNHNSNIIIKTIYIQKKELEAKENRIEDDNERLNKLNIALKSIDDHEFANIVNINRRIEKFIEMLSNPKYTNYINGLLDSNNIFSSTNKVSFEGYEHIAGLNTSKLWVGHSNLIIKTINIQKKELESKENRTEDDNERLNKLNIALKSIDDYEISNNNNAKRRIEKFIEMLSNPKYTNYINGLPDSNNILSSYNEVRFEGYEHIDGLNTSQFWSTNSSKIIETINTQKKELEVKENRTQADNEKLNKLNIVLKAIDDYGFLNKSNAKRRIEKFIEMLSNPKYTNYINGLPDSNNIFSSINKVGFEGYEHIAGLNTSYFWHANSSKIIDTIYAQKKELESKENRTQSDNERLNKLNIALKAIDDYDFSNKSNVKRRIEKFIEMLSNPKYTNYINGLPDSNNIFSSINKVGFEKYEHIDGLYTSKLWNRNLNEILETIHAKKKELESKENRTEVDNERLNKLNIALKSIDDYEFANKGDAKRRVEKFIEMLTNSKYTNYINGLPDSNNILFSYNKVSFEGYEHINGLKTSDFYNHNSKRFIIPLLFYNKIYERKNKTYITSDLDYSSSKYDSARNAVMEYLNQIRKKRKQPEFKTIDEYIDTLDNTKKETKVLMELRDSLLLRKEQLCIENQELTKEYNSFYRRTK